jgi:uncharacterized protein HemX
MKRLRFWVLVLAVMGMAVLYSCGQSQQQEEKKEKTGTEEMDKEEKTRQMIREAEEMEGDTASGA